MTMSIAPHSALGEFEDEYEGEYEGEDFDLGGVISGLMGEGELEDEAEYEYEGEWEGEFEDESESMANPLRRIYPDAMMEHLGHAAAEAETEAEAEAFVGALVPLAARLAKSAAPHVVRATPHLVRGLSKVTHQLRGKPATRPLVRTIPTIAARTTRSLARQVAHGRPITARRAIRTLAGQTAAVLRNPRTRHRVIRHARALDRNYHHATRTGQWWQGAPTGRATTVSGQRFPAGYGTSVRYGAPARYGASAQYGVPPRRRAHTSGRPGRARSYPRQQRLPAGLSIAWVPVPAWSGSQPPPGARRY
jgi:hypothetical protein